ncbi:MAG: hypothetical protein DIU61_013500 [Bacteroidota bacterium]|jgi:hypothetical protein|nr:MAG: hypothetical protein DIU61_17640 [Bacteroidota bacterium]
MKTGFKFLFERLVTATICVVLLSSCYVYKPLGKGDDDRSDDIIQWIQPRKHYAILEEGGQKVKIRVDSVMHDRLTGKASIRKGREIMHVTNHIVYRDSILTVRRRKFSVPLTVAVVLGTPLLIALIKYEPFTTYTF